MLAYTLPPPDPTAVTTLAAGQSKGSVELTARAATVWLRVSMPSSADVDVTALHVGRTSMHLARTPVACPVAAGRRICTYQLGRDARGRWQVSLHKRSTAAAVVRVQLIQHLINVPPPR
jgi:hypothetical protein